MTSTDISAEGPTPTRMRQAMGRFATGVTVVTGADEAGPVGFTCQSFSSVSLDPPLVLFCADHRGSAWPRIRGAGRFCVNVLDERQADLCARFGSRSGLRYQGLNWELSRWDTPILPGVLLRVHSEVSEVHTAGDHDVVIGWVLDLETDSEQRPLLFYRGGFELDPQPDPTWIAEWATSDRWG